MKITRVSTCATMVVLSLFPLATVRAQVPGVPGPPSLGLTLGLKVTTLGFGPEIGYSFMPRLGIRAGANWAGANRDVTVSDFAYGASVKLRSFDALLDLKLLGPLRFSAGVVSNGNRLELRANPTGSVTIGGTTYTSSDVDTIHVKIDFKKMAPYFGLGFATGGRIGFVMEFGAMMQGSPRVTYTATTSLTGPARTQFETEANRERDELQADLDDRSYLKVWPVVGLGLQVKI
jgi:hypothetical protein